MSKGPTLTRDHIKALAESDLLAFIKLVAPHRVLGPIHEELITWWTRTDAKSHQLVLLPRDHQKSAMVAYRVAWEITKNPAIRVLYISSTSNLAEKQLKMIKDILTSRKYKSYWPDMVHDMEGLREKWTNTEISVDHPKRREEGVRDPTVFTGGLTTSLTGLHCDIAVLDDVVVSENAYTEEGRSRVTEQYSLLASIESTDAREWVVGTRYHPADLYTSLREMTEETYNSSGEVLDNVSVYEVFERQVEDLGDGSGEFIWPRAQRADGKWFGFDQKILARKRAQYLDKGQFYSQYYNDPNHYEDAIITNDLFQYYDRAHVRMERGRWYVMGKPCNVFAAMDFAYTIKKRSDYSAIVVIAVDSDGHIYVLDIDRFKSDKMSDMFEHIRASHAKWEFRKIRMEMTAAQAALVRELRESYIRPYGLALSIDEYYPSSRKEGSKEERIEAALRPRYENKTIWHFKGGHCSTLEQELIMAQPPHDDIKDTLAAAVSMSVVPRGLRNRSAESALDNTMFHSRFGGVNA